MSVPGLVAWRAAAIGSRGPVRVAGFPCGHYVPEEQPERLVDELRRFFKTGR